MPRTTGSDRTSLYLSPDRSGPERPDFLAARFSVRRSFSVFCGFFFTWCLGLSELWLMARMVTEPATTRPPSSYRWARACPTRLSRRGHRWTRVADSGGSIVFCTRCGGQRHSRPAVADIHHRTHVNLAYEVTLREESGADEIDVPRS